MLKRTVLLLLLIAWCGEGSANSLDRYRLNGFSSIRVVSAEDSNVRYEDGIDYKADNLAGVQLTGYISDRSRVTMVISTDGNDDYTLSLDWFYFTYVLPNDWLLNIGRIGTPFYLYSDIENVRFFLRLG